MPYEIAYFRLTVEWFSPPEITAFDCGIGRLAHFSQLPCIKWPLTVHLLRNSGKQVGLLKSHFGHVTCVDSGRKFVGEVEDGLLVLTGSYDCSLQLWDLRVSVPVRTLIAHTAPVTSCCFSRDRKVAISSGLDCVCRIFDIVKAYSEPPFNLERCPVAHT